LKNQLVRQLINYSINREKLIHKLPDANLIPAHLMIPASLFGYNPYYRIDYQNQNKIQATINQKEISFTLLIHPGQAKTAGFLKNELEKNGITMNIQTISLKEYYPTLSQNIRSSILLEALPDYPSAYNFLYQLYETGNILNYFQIDSPEILEKIKKLPEIDIKEQASTLEQINHLIELESYYIPLFYNYYNIIIKDKIKKLHFKYAGTIDFSSIEVKNESIN
jgi:ABC-type transport system substrate-binding protein